ncbi:MAG: ABC transporter substrate-binding protein [Clostridia bacterium]|nr:ABC transporter substrate-binding protein [Clostridia bacterium]
MKLRRLVSLIASAALLLTCFSAAGAEGETAEKVYRTYMTSDSPVLSAHDSVETSVEKPLLYCSTFLFRAVPDDDGMGYHYIGDIASELPIKVDDYTWQIKLNPEAHWYNGDPINADTMIYSYQMLLDPILANKMADFLSDYNITIVNAKDYSLQGTSNTISWDEVGIKKIDDYTLEIHTVDANTEADVCAHFTNRATGPVYEPLYEAGMNEDRTSTTYGTSLDNWMSCGPYYLDTWTYDSIQIYKKNDTYWHSDLFHYDTVEVRIIPEMNARVELWEQGLLDDFTPDANTIETYIDDPRTVEYPSLTVFHIDVNCKNPDNPLCTSINYRKALYHAMNREVIAHDLFGYQEPSGTYVNGMAGLLSESGLTYRESEYGKAVTALVESWGPYGYNPELAREYLAKAYEECGVSDDTVVTLTMAFDESDTAWKATAEYLMEEFPVIFEGKLQIKIVTYAGMSTTDYKKTTDTWDLSPNDWSRGAARTYPYTCFYYYLSSYASHPNNFFDADFEEQYAVADSVKSDYTKMLEETAKLEEIYLEKVINIPMVQEINYQLFSDRLVLPVQTYIPGIGWGTMFGDIAE